uniref:hypothetical protein n=1 Tax=Vibrio diabolicus TaxID=50719 RepID=UPI002ED7F107
LVGLTCAYLAAKVPLIPLATRTGLLIALSLLVTLIVCQLEDMNKPLIWQITSLRWILILLASYQLIRAALCHMKQHNNSQHLPTESQRLTERVGSG